MYTFPHDVIKHLRAGHIPIQGPCACIGLKSLRVLNFYRVNIAGKVLEYFLSNCSVLEQLLVCNSPYLSNLRVVGSSVALKYLLIQFCRNIKSSEFCDANLVSFIYDGDCRNFLLRNVPLLVEVSVYTPYSKECIEVTVTQLSCLLSQLKILKLDHLGRYETDRVRQYKKDLVFPVLASLKHLEIHPYTEDDCILLQLTSFLKATPNLESLVLVMNPSFPWMREVKYKAAKCSYQHLRVVQLVAYDAGDGYSTNHLEVVKYLIESAIKLGKIVIAPNDDDEEKKDRVRRKIEEEVKKHEARSHFGDQLIKIVPLTIAFVE